MKPPLYGHYIVKPFDIRKLSVNYIPNYSGDGFVLTIHLYPLGPIFQFHAVFSEKWIK